MSLLSSGCCPTSRRRVVGRDFAADVTWQIQAPEEHVERLAAALVELSHGEIEVVL